VQVSLKVVLPVTLLVDDPETLCVIEPAQAGVKVLVGVAEAVQPVTLLEFQERVVVPPPGGNEFGVAVSTTTAVGAAQVTVVWVGAAEGPEQVKV
jgi:hypothetical protein